MPTPLYDDAAFFDGYSHLRQNPLSANEVIEIPAVKALLPPLAGLRVLDLGCGTGGLCRYMAEQGAATVIGVDVSARMLRQAQSQDDFNGRITYTQAGIENYDAPEGAFDVVVSSLALHYVDDISVAFARAAKWLASGGDFILSVEHPLQTAGIAPHEGWEKDAGGRRVAFRVNHYFDETMRVRTWIVDGVTTYHRTLSTYFNALTRAGFTILEVVEPAVSLEFAAQNPAFESARHRPLFLCVRAKTNPSR